MLKQAIILLCFCFCIACHNDNQEPPPKENTINSNSSPNKIKNPKMPTKQAYIQVLGIAQDAGYPQAACAKDCCKAAWENQELHCTATSLALVDPMAQEYWLFEVTPDFKHQLYQLTKSSNFPRNQLPKGIFISHAHIGHYTGLIHLGREVIGAKEIPLYAMPRLADFLTNHGPWSQLVKLGNIALQEVVSQETVDLAVNLKVTPIQVPHRDEFSETVGFLIESSQKKALFIPDIDKWGKWSENIKEYIQKVDVAFLDGTFFKNGEIPGRDMSEIPHPFIEESMALFEDLSKADKAKIHFIHFNHTNPILQPDSPERIELKTAGFNIALEGMVIPL